METSTLLALLNDQKTLIASAALALPHKFETCTYNLGSIRQSVYLCITCNERRGICQSCSISCHGDHEQIELFPKRGFRCDCPTKGIPGQSCKLNEGGTGEKLEINKENVYGQNYEDGGRFCRCHSLYDAERERETMVQCLACEDWFHESCLNLRERIQPRSIAPTPHRESSAPSELPPTAASLPSVTEILENQPERYWDYENEDDEEQDPTIPPALIPATEYDMFVCGPCVRGSAMLRKWAGTAGIKMVVRDQGNSKWRVLEEKPSNDGTQEGSTSQTNSVDPIASPKLGEKRSREHLEEELKDEVPPSKKPRLEEGSSKACSCPTPNLAAQRLLDRLEGKTPEPLENETILEGTGDIFLTHGWRERWCRCSNCLLFLMARSYLDQEEETYEPPQDPDAGLSLEELGMRALETLPREQALEGIRAFQSMSAELRAYLVPFAESGKVVTVDVIREFFEARKREDGTKR